MTIERIKYNDQAKQEIDEVLVTDVSRVFLERMDNGHIWMTIDSLKGERVIVNLYTKRNGMILGSADIEKIDNLHGS